MKFSGKYILMIFFIVLTTAVVFCLWALYTRVNLARDITFEVLPGASSREVAYDLAKRRIIESPWLFNSYIKLRKLDRELQSGQFVLASGTMSLSQLIDILTTKANRPEVTFTIPEGFTMEQIADLLSQKGLVDKSEFMQLTPEQIRTPDFGLQTSQLEGYLFPDTYQVFADATPADIAQKMISNFNRHITPEIQAKITPVGPTLGEIVIVASILEKEVKTDEDMGLVSDIVWRRLKTDYPLELCSTLNYILDEKHPALTAADLAIDSPYNTYKYKGLPPTAIGNPGQRALTAAASPIANDYWFYLSKPDGTTVFSRTYEEHLRAKALYIK